MKMITTKEVEENGIVFPNSVINADYLDVIKYIPKESVDLIICDPPYGNFIACDWDKKIDLDLMWNSYSIVKSKKCTACIFSSQPFTTELINSNRKDYYYSWYWNKNQGTNFLHAKIMPIRKIEEICVFYKGNYYPQMSHGHKKTNSAKGCSNGNVYYGKNKRNYAGGTTERFPTNILNFKCVDNYSRVHSAEKPVDLLEYLIKTYSNEGDIVLDTFAGSGSTAIAAMNTGRKFIVIEKERKYCDIIVDRINKNTRNELF